MSGGLSSRFSNFLNPNEFVVDFTVVVFWLKSTYFRVAVEDNAKVVLDRILEANEILFHDGTM